MVASTDRLATGRAALHLDIRGVVQGVGFRPFVYRLAQQYALTGWVRNTSWGVELAIEGQPEALERFVSDLRAKAPPLAHIETLARRAIAANGYRAFEILASEVAAGAFQPISPDIATCADCLRELFDQHNRRYRYPFINCTNCGPRFTIIDDVPYDRARTTMRAFRMCPDCQREYDDPGNRRFHAQPNACPVCGPQVALWAQDGRPLASGDEALRRAAALLQAGQIVAVKGLGGFLLACDATQANSVRRLRERKRRPHKPFAIMLPDMAALEAQVLLEPAERALLASPAAPIVLARRRDEATVAPDVAPDTEVLGVMLPYTPLHHILLRDTGLPLVMTSGNLSEEPLARDNAEALRRLGAIADYFLVHDRDINTRVDDSVWFVPASGPQPVRRARGHAPTPTHLPVRTRPTLACGAELKNTLCLAREDYAFLSQHIGDLENLETYAAFEESLALLERVFHVQPEVVAYDLHPDYLASRYAQSLQGLAGVAVQHHHAHLAACLADTATTEPAIGVILDGTGYGLDGHIWGGEFLVGNARGFARLGHLQYLPLPGGDAATRHPYRLALAYWQVLLGERPLPPALERISPAERDIVRQMVTGGVRTPLTSSAGRLFDAVSALLGVCTEASYEAQAAIELEMRCEPVEAAAPYPYTWRETAEVASWGQVDLPWQHGVEVLLAPLFAALADDLAAGMPVAVMAWRFHLTLAEMLADLCAQISAETGLSRVALSGGCFQNRRLLDLSVAALGRRGLDVLLHRQVPCNDGGLALGQALIAHYAVSGE